MKKILPSRRFWQSFLAPPYRNLPWLIFGYVVMCNLILHNGGVFTGHIIGFDDQVRMTQVLNWVNGAGFYDRTIMRANPPEGFTSIWSRIVDIPLALVVIIFQKIVPQKVAALIAVTIIPLVLLSILFVAAPYFVRPLVGKDKARLIVLFIFFTSVLNVKFFSISGFLVGQASHHPWYIILNLLMFGAVARLVMGSFSYSPQLIMAASIALLTAVGIEGYPMIAGATTILVLVAWAAQRPRLAERGFTALIGGTVGSLLLLPMHQPIDHFFVISFAEPSILGVILIACAALFLKFEQIILQSMLVKKVSQALLLMALAACMAGILITAFPDILKGATAGLSPAERKMALGEHFEARSLYAVSTNLIDFLGLVMPILIAITAALFSLYTTRGRRRAVSFCYLGFALLGSGMSALYSRYYHHALTTACAWLLWSWEKIKEHLAKNKNYGLFVLFSFIGLGPFWMLLLPAIEKNLPISTHVLLFPAVMNSAVGNCDSLSLADYINAHYNKNTLLIVPSWQSAQFLYQTDVRLDFIANYPSHDKFKDNYLFFGARNEIISAELARTHHIDLIAVCADYPVLFNKGLPDYVQSFISRLQVGHTPSWVKKVETGIQTDYVLYEVDQTALAQKVHHE